MQDPDAQGSSNGTHGVQKKSFTDHINDIAQEPLTPLTKILLVLVLFLLLLTSVFIGLFAGAEHKLKNGDKGSPTVTATATWTSIGNPTLTITGTLTATVPNEPGPTAVPGAVRISTIHLAYLNYNALV